MDSPVSQKPFYGGSAALSGVQKTILTSHLSYQHKPNTNTIRRYIRIFTAHTGHIHIAASAVVAAVVRMDLEAVGALHIVIDN